MGVVNAGVLREIEQLPEEWPADFCAFHTPEWWRHHWTLTMGVEVEVADNLPNGRDLWLRWHRAIGETNDLYLTSPAGENLAFNRIIGRRIG